MNPTKKTKKNSLILVSNDDDWEALYVNGKKVFAHHHVPIEEISKWSAKLGVVIEKRWTTQAYTEKCYDTGDFDDDLKNVELEPKK